MMQALALIIAPLMGMALAFIGVARFGFLAGAAEGDRKMGLGALMLGMVLMVMQGALWATWGMHLGRALA